MQKMTNNEREEVTIFAEFILTRRHLHSLHMLNDDIPTSDLLGLAAGSGSFDWLNRAEEDGYSFVYGIDHHSHVIRPVRR